MSIDVEAIVAVCRGCAEGLTEPQIVNALGLGPQHVTDVRRLVRELHAAGRLFTVGGGSEDERS